MKRLSCEEISSPDISHIKHRKPPSTPNEKRDQNEISIQTPQKTPSSSSAPRRVKNRKAAFSVKEIRKAASRSSDSIIELEEDSNMKFAKRQTAEWLEEPRPKMKERTPHKFEHLIILFDGMNVAVKLLKLKRIDLYFSNISRSVESIAGRRFTCNHLAQMNYLVPECIEITRTNVLNERTGCKNPELLVNLNPDAIPTVVKMDAVTKLKAIFRSKLEDFSRSNPEIGDVPEATLPEPFNKKQASPISYTPSLENGRNMLKEVTPASHLPPKRKQKVHTILHEKAEVASPKKMKCHEDVLSPLFTPIKDVTIPYSPFPNTPALPPEKSGCKDEPPRKTVKSVSRSLFSKPADYGSDPIFSNKFIESVSDKVRKIEEENNDRGINRRRKMLVRLPKLFDKIHFLYQSLNKSVISKEELIHKLVFRDLGLIDRGELEEELNYMLELIPDYISEKILLSGDLAIRVDKTASSWAREKLEAAKSENLIENDL